MVKNYRKREAKKETYKQDANGNVIKPCALHGVGMVGVLNNVVIRRGGKPVPYSRLINGGNYG